jgi:hypothetical protein
VTSHSPHKHHHHKTATKLNDSDKNVLWHIIFNIYGRGEFLTAKRLNVEMKEIADSDGSK